jgi:pyruvate formate lyase activating enzyme
MSLKELIGRHTMPAAPELTQREGNALRCVACGHRCLIQEGRSGVCRIRFNEGGTLRVPAGYVAGLAVDPIEKKPFYHAFPGRDAMSFGMLGCDFHCAYCQNWFTSQALRDPGASQHARPVTPEALVAAAVEHHCRVVTSTYNEPLITAEWAHDVFALKIYEFDALYTAKHFARVR